MKNQLILSNGKPLVLPTTVLDEGGEAYVYKLDRTRLAKIYKLPDDISYTSLPPQIGQEASLNAAQRIRIHQDKLKKIPQINSQTILTPQELIFDEKGMIRGYVTKLIDNPLNWKQFINPANRKGNLQNDMVTKMLLELYDGVQLLHDKEIVLGDFNDSNFLIKDNHVWFIDVDSFQFDKFQTETYTQTFVDPMICEKSAYGNFLVKTKPYSKASDYYSYSVFMMQSLLLTHPYTGQINYKDPKLKVDNALRPLFRESIFDKKKLTYRDDVRLPKYLNEITPKILPNDLSQYLWEVFVNDNRLKLDRRVLEVLVWKTCSTCGTYHARTQCPSCTTVVAAPAISFTKINGVVTATILFDSGHSILMSQVQNGNLMYLYSKDSHIYREGGKLVMPGTIDSTMKIAICGFQTIIAKDRQIAVLEPNQKPILKTTSVFAGYPIFASNSKNYFWIEDGEIRRNHPSKIDESRYISLGSVLQDKTLMWVGEEFGFGLFGNKSLYQLFTFDLEKKAFNDSVPIVLKGTIVDASASFTDELCWFFVQTKDDAGQSHRNVYVIDRYGKLLAQREDNSLHWLRSVRGKFPLGDKCFTNTEDGIYKLGFDQGMVVELQYFPDTEPWGDDFGRIHVMNDGIIVNDGKKISKLQIK